MRRQENADVSRIDFPGLFPHLSPGLRLLAPAFPAIFHSRHQQFLMAGEAESRAKGTPQEIGRPLLPCPASLMKKMTGDTADPVFSVKGHIRRNSKRRGNRDGVAEPAAVRLRLAGIVPMAHQADIPAIGMKTQGNPFCQGQGHMAIQTPDLRVIMGPGGRQGCPAETPGNDQKNKKKSAHHS